MAVRAGVVLSVLAVCAAAVAVAAGDLNAGGEAVATSSRKLLASCPRHHEPATIHGRRTCGAHMLPVHDIRACATCAFFSLPAN